MKVSVTVGDEVQEVDVSLGAMTLQESCALEDALGEDRYEKFQKEQRFTPKVMRAILWAKLHRQFPEVTLEGFDVDLSAVDVSEDEPSPLDET